MADQSDKTAYQSKMAFVVGYTGEIGKELVKELLQRRVFQKVVLLGRRQVQLDGDLCKNAEQKVIDFDNLDQFKAALDGCVVGFCCLGTTRGKGGKAGFVKVEHDYVVGIAKLAYECGVQHFAVISAVGTDKNSWFLYQRTKGLMEHHVAEIGFPRFTIYRPGFLLCDRQEFRLGECVALTLMKPLFWAKPTSFSVPTNTVAKAMIADLWRKPAKNVEIISNAEIHEMAKSV